MVKLQIWIMKFAAVATKLESVLNGAVRVLAVH